MGRGVQSAAIRAACHRLEFLLFRANCVGSFATDQTLSDSDLALLAMAQRGQKESLRAVCQRFRTPLLALLVRGMRDWERASAAVEPLLEQLCGELVRGQLVATDWAARAAESASERAGLAAGSEPPGSGLEGLASIPRVIKRRILRQALPEFPLPELLALLLVHLEHPTPTQMVGLVAGNEPDVQACLVAAYDKAQAALDRQLADQESAR